MRDLKLIQSTKHIPIIVVAQQNREKKDDGTHDTTQIADADEVGRYATIVIFVDKKDNIMKLELAKNRDGIVGQTLSYDVDINKGRFLFIPEDGKQVSPEVVKSYETNNEEDYF